MCHFATGNPGIWSSNCYASRLDGESLAIVSAGDRYFHGPTHVRGGLVLGGKDKIGTAELNRGGL